VATSDGWRRKGRCMRPWTLPELELPEARVSDRLARPGLRNIRHRRSKSEFWTGVITDVRGATGTSKRFTRNGRRTDRRVFPAVRPG
jgi:hypothetical protein